MNSKKYIVTVMALSVAGIMALTLTALAANKEGKDAKNGNRFGFGQLKNAPERGIKQGQGIFGTVSAISGTTITVAATKGFSPNSPATTTYTVDAANATVIKNNATSTVASIAVGDTISVKGTINGTNVTATSIRDGQMMNRGQGISGTVATVSGNTFTVTAKQGSGTTTTTYTVDATNAKITKDNASGTMSSILVGDTVWVQGTVTNTNVVATTVWDGVMPGQGLGKGIDKNQTAPNLAISGNGQPIVAGTISTISGNTITITNKSNVTYTIDATNAKITQGQNTITVAGLKNGDAVVIQGAVTGNSVVASSIIDQTKPASTTTTTNATNNGNHFGFLGNLGQFFMHLFGF